MTRRVDEDGWTYTLMNTSEAAAFYLALAGMTLIATAWIWA